MLFTPKKTFDLILCLGCHFLAQVKRNCRTLWEKIALYTAFCNPISTFEYYENKHGHQIYRRVELYVNEAELPKGWNGIQRLVKVRRYGYRNHKPYYNLSFYVLSQPLNSASEVANAIQGHWGIENNLHWTKDVIMGEDDMTPKEKTTVTMIVYFNNAAINLLRNAGYKPVKDTFVKFPNKVNELYKLFNWPDKK